ncbi:MAG: hypothetical protein M1436_07680 [Acidobacteria bacterium]|nr:hypothetical protein [Acidobacteriota bacterium]
MRHPVRGIFQTTLALSGALAAAVVYAQTPRIGAVEFYGFRKVPEAKAQSVLGIKVGDPIPGSKGDLEQKLEAIPGIVQARVEAVCCQEGKAVLFVGVEEKAAPRFAFRSSPAGQATLPASIIDTYHEYMDAVESAARRGIVDEDLTQGHPLMADPVVRGFEQRFAAFASANLKLLRAVLRDGPEADQRAMAATLIGYAPGKKAVVDDLQYAMQDPDESVRANAMRSLTAIAALAARKPALGIKISPTWFVEMLNSIVLSDRVRAATALVSLTESNPAALDQIRRRALDAVLEMARWKTLRYALPSFILAGRLAGLSEQRIQDAWTGGRRQEVIDQARKAAADGR